MCKRDLYEHLQFNTINNFHGRPFFTLVVWVYVRIDAGAWMILASLQVAKMAAYLLGWILASLQVAIMAELIKLSSE